MRKISGISQKANVDPGLSIEQLFNRLNKISTRLDSLEAVVDDDKTPVSQIVEKLEEALDGNTSLNSRFASLRTSSSSAAASTDELVKVDADATGGYLGASGSTGVLRVDASMGYTDGGNFVSIGLDTTLKSNYDAAYSHVSASGASHSDVALNTTHRTSTGIDHSNVVLNNAHRVSDGKDHSDVVLNNAHRISVGTDHTYIDQDYRVSASPTHVGLTLSGLTASRLMITDGSKNVSSIASDVTSAELEELTDGSTTALHAHAGGASPGGSNTHVQWNNAGSFDGDAGFTYDGAGTAYAQTAYDTANVYQINASNVIDISGTNVVRIGPTGNTTTGQESVFVGKNIFGSTASTSNMRNICIGVGIANATTLAGALGNIMIGGQNAVNAAFNSDNNVFIGYNSGYDYRAGTGANVFIGPNTGTFIQTGSYNFALGVYALYNAGTAVSQCVAIGRNALYNCASDHVIGIGNQVNYAGSGGNHSIYIGSDAAWNTTGGRNFIVGYQSAYRHQGGTNNILIGYRVAYGSSAYSFYRNVIFGTEAFYNATTGGRNNNVIIGYQAHYSSPAAECIVLGAYSGYRNATDDRLIIDNVDRGSAANEVIGSIIHGDMNSTASSQALRLNANVTIRYARYEPPDEITATSGGVAASLTTVNTEVTTNGDADLDDVTLANGTSGQTKKIYCVALGNAADTWKITPTNLVGGTQITFTGAGQGCILEYADNEGWVIVGNNGGTIT